jgi:hypothetical protein
MMRGGQRILSGVLAFLFVLLAFAPAALAVDPYYTWPDSTQTGRRLARASVEVFGANFVVWTFNRFIRPGPEGGEKGDGFDVGFNSWWNNIKNGFEWDDNNFGTNQWGHPYHGALFFTAGRANGFSFWDSAPFAFAGSFAWEYFGETHNPSFNDWVNTAVGGVALGEVLHRASSMVLDNEARHGERVWREIGGAVINPVRGFNRLITGEARKQYPNPANRFPETLGVNLELGLRTEGEDRIWDGPTTRTFVRMDLIYGNPFDNVKHDPFSSFIFSTQINFSDASPIGEFNARGILGGTDLYSTDSSRHILASYHHFDYVDNQAVKFGAQSVGVTLQSRMTGKDGGGDLALRTRLDGNVILLGATQEDYLQFTGRDYDYGPGGTLKVSAAFIYHGIPIFGVNTTNHFLHTINGTNSDHFISIHRFRAQIPVWGQYGVALDYLLYARRSAYQNFDDVDQRSPEVRFTLFSGFYN